MNKVAQVTLAFWVLKVLATTLGETAGDFISMTLKLGYYAGLGITAAALVVVLAAQVGSRKLHLPLFWLAIVATTTVGTEISDYMDRSLGLGYVRGSALLLAGLAATLAVWYARERSLRVHPLTKPRVEVLFWVAVLFSNSLGTAFGDFLVDNAGLSFVQGALVTAGIIAVVAALHYATKVNEVALFWIAFVFTRPFGATFGDFLTKGHDVGGLALGRGASSAVTMLLLAGVLVWTMYRSGTTGRATE
ncbi:MAG: hypothetical protein GC129_05025 [Proteobacteria bacterium]|nr:hypothetical protein [Pseudomonadota bacterium]